MELTQAMLTVLGVYVGIPVALIGVVAGIRAWAFGKRLTLKAEEEQTFTEVETEA